MMMDSVVLWSAEFQQSHCITTLVRSIALLLAGSTTAVSLPQLPQIQMTSIANHATCIHPFSPHVILIHFEMCGSMLQQRTLILFVMTYLLC